MHLKSPVGRLRLVSIIEGISYLLLLGIAMPLKYLAGRPEAVSVVGMVHGILTMVFVFALLHVVIEHRWPILHALGALIASIIPFGAFAFERWVRRGIAQGKIPA